jgi:hypothetical protein
MARPSSIGGINALPYEERLAYYSYFIPDALMDKYGIPADFRDPDGHPLIELKCPPGSTSCEISLYHQYGFMDPVLYGHITDTVSNQIHVLLYVLNDPEAQRFNTDRLPDGAKTHFGINIRNIPAEIAAMQAGLTPGQVRKGPHILNQAVESFELFVQSLGNEVYFVEPLYYHNALIFERYGFTYQQGKRLMQRIEDGFKLDGDLRAKLDNSTPFRKPEAAGSIRLRSWAIHDGIMGEPFTNVTMYKYIGKHAGMNTCPECEW